MVARTAEIMNINQVFFHNFGSSLKDIFVNKDFGEYDIIIDTQKRLITTLALKRIKTKVFIVVKINILLEISFDLF